VQDLRDEEMVFLGMQRPSQQRAQTAQPGFRPKDDFEDPLLIRSNQRQMNKMVQEGNERAYQRQKKELLREIKDVEGFDIKDKMLKERRDWVQEQKSMFGKPPANMDGFHKRLDEQEPLSPEDEEARKAEEEEGGKGKKDKKKDKKKKKKGKKGDKDGKADDKIAKVGPNELVRKFDVFYEDYSSKWSTRDETANPE
jgi:hypothetical protein